MEILVKRFQMPTGAPVRTVDIRELFGADETEAASMVDALANPALGHRGLVEAERREGIRVSIVALDGKSVDTGAPLFVIDSWSRACRKALERFFGNVNGVARAELVKLAEAAEAVYDPATGRAGRKFKLPARCSIPEVTLWEMTAHDEIKAALRVDRMPPLGGMAVALLRQRRELIRGAMGDAGEAVDFDTWTMRTSMAVSVFFEEVNGIPEDEISGAEAGAVYISGAPPAEINQPLPPTEGAAAGGTGT